MGVSGGEPTDCGNDAIYEAVGGHSIKAEA
jgi:hypothetical protein